MSSSQTSPFSNDLFFWGGGKETIADLQNIGKIRNLNKSKGQTLR